MQQILPSIYPISMKSYSALHPKLWEELINRQTDRHPVNYNKINWEITYFWYGASIGG